MSEAKELEYVAIEAVEVEDARTGEIIPIKPEPPRTNTLATSLDLTKVGTLVLDEKAATVFAEPLDPEQVKIRPDGMLYLPWTWYAERLNRALGRLQWGLVPQAGPQTKDMGNNMVLVVWGHWFVVRGVPVGFEIGETAYRTNNNKMSFGDAAAGAKSNSLARNCKMLGMSLELWDMDYVSAWRKKYAETYEDNGTKWRKKSVLRREAAQAAQTTQEDETVKAEQIKKDALYQDVQDTPVPEKQYTVKGLREFAVIKHIAEVSGKQKSAVANVVNGLDVKSKYTVSDVVKLLNGVNGEKENVPQ